MCRLGARPFSAKPLSSAALLGAEIGAWIVSGYPAASDRSQKPGTKRLEDGTFYTYRSENMPTARSGAHSCSCSQLM